MPKKKAETRVLVAREATNELIDDLAMQRDTLVGHLRGLLEVTRARALTGMKPMRCMACDRPHPVGIKICSCPHHAAMKFLQTIGYDIKESGQ